MTLQIFNYLFKDSIVLDQWLFFVKQLKGKFKGLTRRTRERNYTSVWLFDLHLVAIDVSKLEAKLEGAGVTRFNNTEYLFNIQVNVKAYNLHMVKSHYMFDAVTQVPTVYNKLEYESSLHSTHIKCLKGDMTLPRFLLDPLQLSIKSKSDSVGMIVQLLS